MHPKFNLCDMTSSAYTNIMSMSFTPPMYIQTSHLQSTQTSHRQITQPTNTFQTPQEPLFCFQNESMIQFNQPVCPQVTQPTRSKYDNMGAKLNYDSVDYCEDMIDNSLDNTNISWTSYQTPQAQPNTRRLQIP